MTTVHAERQPAQVIPKVDASVSRRELIEKAIRNVTVVTAERCKRKFYVFMHEMWETVSSEECKWNWHIEYLCMQLQQVAERVGRGESKAYDLIINVPPGTTKSITCSIMFPVWCWTRWPWMRFIVGSYSSALSLEHAEYSRELVRSEKFKTLFPHLEIKQDKDTKSNFRIVERLLDGTTRIGGNRYTTSVGGTLTGFHGHILIVDDPLNPKEAVSEQKIKVANHWMEQTLSTRKVDKAVTPTILIMQRLHQDDPTGHMLNKRKKNVHHICLPGEIRDYGPYVRPVELVTNYIDKLLDPVRMPWSVLEDMKADLGQYGYAGQVGQNPVPPTGGMFQVHNFQVIDLEPHAVNVLQTVRYWDKAGTTGAGAYTVGCKMARLASGKFVVLDVRRGQWATEMREAVIQQMAESDGQNCVIYHEQEPGPIWEEELVQMADGSQKKLKDITKNDRIIDGKGKIAKVKKVFIQGKLPCLCITTFSGRTIHAALNHPFLTPTGYVNVNELLVGEMLALRTKREIEPISKPTLEECRLAGYFIGDGCCTYQHPNNPRDRSINAKITCSDPIEGQDILHCVESIGARGRIGPSGIHYAFGGGICDWLRKRELAGKGTLDKKVPEWIATADDKCVANFIGAYFACDGYAMFGKGGKTIEFYSTTHPLISRVQSLLLRFGIYSRLRAKKLPLEFQKTRHICYYLKLTKGRHDDSCAKFAHRIPVHGKKDRYLKKMFRHDFDAPYLADEIMSITRVEKELPCRCLEIEGDPSFLVNDIVVHNSGGKESAQATVRNLAGFANYADRPTGDKVFRADPYSVQVNNGNVMLLRGEWNQAFIEEHRFFPYGTHKDQVDAAAGACAKLAAKKMVRRIV